MNGTYFGKKLYPKKMRERITKKIKFLGQKKPISPYEFLNIRLFLSLHGFRALIGQHAQILYNIYGDYNKKHAEWQNSISFSHFAILQKYAFLYHFLELLPLFAFLWAMFGFAAVALCCDALLLKQFLPYLPEVDAAGDIIPEDQLDDPGLLTGSSREQMRDEEAKTLAEMTKYGL